MLTRGQGEPSGIVSGSCGLSSVHGQPVLPGGGGGSSLRVGQRMGTSIFWNGASGRKTYEERLGGRFATAANPAGDGDQDVLRLGLHMIHQTIPAQSGLL